MSQFQFNKNLRTILRKLFFTKNHCGVQIVTFRMSVKGYIIFHLTWGKPTCFKGVIGFLLVVVYYYIINSNGFLLGEFKENKSKWYSFPLIKYLVYLTVLFISSAIICPMMEQVAWISLFWKITLFWKIR